MTQGNRIKEIRKNLNLTLEKFGEKLGVTKTAISRLEKDERSLTDQMAKSICREFNVNYDYLTEGEGEMFSDIPETILDELCQQYNCDTEDRSMVLEYLKLDPASRKVLKDYMKAVLGHNVEPIPTEQPTAVSQDFSDLSIDEKVAQYRRQLELEERVTVKSEVS